MPVAKETMDLLPSPTCSALQVRRGWYIVVELDHAQWETRPEAVALAARASTYQRLVSPYGILFHRAVFTQHDALSAFGLIETIGRYAGARVYVRGKLADRDDLRGFLCYAQRHQARRLSCGLSGHAGTSGRPMWLGCLARRVFLDWVSPGLLGERPSKFWFSFGRLEQSTFRTARHRIMEYLIGDGKFALSCPAFDLEGTARIVARLPESFDLGTDWVAAEIRLPRLMEEARLKGEPAPDPKALPPVLPRDRAAYTAFMDRVFAAPADLAGGDAAP